MGKERWENERWEKKDGKTKDGKRKMGGRKIGNRKMGIGKMAKERWENCSEQSKRRHLHLKRPKRETNDYTPYYHKP